jgi:hypothetical protein
MAKTMESGTLSESNKELLLRLLAEREEIALTVPVSMEDLKKKDAEIQRAALGFKSTEEFDSAKEPVLFALLEMAKRKIPMAIRLLLQDRTHVKLYQRPSEEGAPLHDVECGVNGILVSIPRGRKVTVPAVMAEILEQGNVQ